VFSSVGVVVVSGQPSLARSHPVAPSSSTAVSLRARTRRSGTAVVQNHDTESGVAHARRAGVWCCTSSRGTRGCVCKWVSRTWARDGVGDPKRQYVVLSAWHCPLLFSKHGSIHKQMATGQCLMPTPYLKPIRPYVQYWKGRRASEKLQSWTL
jgi:hypothetical protein